MRRIQPGLTLLAAATGVIGIATIAQAAPANESGSNQEKQPQPAAQEQSAQQPGEKQAKQTPDGYVVVDEQIITLTANEPQNHFLRAREYLAANDPKAAAAEVRIGAAYLDMQASRKGNADQQQLRTTSNDLRQLADQIAQQAGQKAEPADQKHFSQAFAHADQVLAQHFQEEAANEIKRQRPIMAGHDLDAAAAALTASSAWSGEKCSKETAQAIADARNLSDELLSPTPKGQAETANNKTQNEEPKGEAQPAAARLSASQSQNQTEVNRIPPDATKVTDELAKAINDVASQNSSGQK